MLAMASEDSVHSHLDRKTIVSGVCGRGEIFTIENGKQKGLPLGVRILL